MADLLISNGTIIDGTGRSAYIADVRVRGGKIAEIGHDLEPAGEEILDAGSCFVTPGFIEIHTHLDPTLFWDRTCDPMPQHGVTSVLVGNCSLSLAPVRPEHRQSLTELFCYIEDLPELAFEQSISFAWADYGQYLDALVAEGASLNVATMVGHTPLRLHVMGEEAWNRPSTVEERGRIAELLESCLAAGAFGMSTSLGFDEDRSGRPVPSRIADDVELSSLISQLAENDRFLQFIPTTAYRTMRGDVRKVAELGADAGLLSTWIGVLDNSAHPDAASKMLDFATGLQDSGMRTYPQVSPRTLDFQINWSGGMAFAAMADTWQPMVQADRSEKLRMLSDRSWRDRARAEWDSVPFALIPHHRLGQIRLTAVADPALQEWVGSTLEDLVAERKGHPSDVLADWVLANDLAPGVVGVGVANSDPEGVARTLVHPAAIIGNSDAGAHLQMMCAAGDPTLILTRHVRDRGDMSLEQAVHALTGRQADLFGFAGRGIVAKDAYADLTIFNLDELDWGTDVMVDDLPTGAWRLRRPPGGYRWTIVDGVVTQSGGQITGALPGRVLRR